jgi:hypothetical protein
MKTPFVPIFPHHKPLAPFENAKNPHPNYIFQTRGYFKKFHAYMEKQTKILQCHCAQLQIRLKQNAQQLYLEVDILMLFMENNERLRLGGINSNGVFHISRSRT